MEKPFTDNMPRGEDPAVKVIDLHFNMDVKFPFWKSGVLCLVRFSPVPGVEGFYYVRVSHGADELAEFMYQGPLNETAAIAFMKKGLADLEASVKERVVNWRNYL